jgi:hypothetical protein
MLALRTVRVATSTVRRDLACAGGRRWAPDVGGLRRRRGGSIGLPHGESPHAAPPRPIDAPARSTVPWPRGRAGTLLDAESTLINRRLESIRGDPSSMQDLPPLPLGVRGGAPDSNCLGVKDDLQWSVRLNHCRGRRRIILTECRVASGPTHHGRSERRVQRDRPTLRSIRPKRCRR